MDVKLRTRIAGFTAAALVVASPVLAQNALPQLAADTKIAVLSTGTGTKRPLRYKVTAGAKERVDMKMQMGISVELPGMGTQSMPGMNMNMGLDLDVTSVAANGDITSTMTISTVTMDGDGMPGGMLDPLKGMSASMTIDGRGAVKDLKFDDSKVTDPMMKQLIGTAGLDRLASQLPEEAVGLGARWQVTQALDANGIKMDQVTVYEITEMTPTSASFTLTLSQSAPPQTVSPPGMPPGIEASVTGMTGTGTGKMTLVEGTLVLLGDMTLKSNITMDVNAQGQSQRLTTSTDMKMSITRGKR